MEEKESDFEFNYKELCSSLNRENEMLRFGNMELIQRNKYLEKEIEALLASLKELSKR